MLYWKLLLVQSRDADIKRFSMYLKLKKRECNRPTRVSCLATAVIHQDSKLEIKFTDNWQMPETETTRRRMTENKWTHWLHYIVFAYTIPYLYYMNISKIWQFEGVGCRFTHSEYQLQLNSWEIPACVYLSNISAFAYFKICVSSIWSHDTC
jgi:hypothetical protein